MSNGDYPNIFLPYTLYKKFIIVIISFEDLYYSNTVKMPSTGKQPIGAHAMCFVGYDLNKKLLLCRNSFGTNWGIEGYCYIPFDYARNEVMDTWVFDIMLNQ